MNKWLNTLISFLLGLMIFIILLLTSIELIAFNRSYYIWHFENYQIMTSTGMSLDDLMYVTDEMLNYLEGERDNLIILAPIHGIERQVFNEKEILHMIDVQALFMGGRWLRNIGVLLIGLIFFITYRLYDKKMARLLDNIRKVFIGLWCFLLGLVIIISLDFNRAFIYFHECFFSNDLWLLDPNKDTLIQMVPLEFFINTALLIFLSFLVLSGIVLFLIQKIKNRVT